MQLHPTKALLAAACSIAIFTNQETLANISTFGDVNPTYNSTDPWNVSGTLNVGQTGTGSVGVDGGSILNSDAASIGTTPSGSGSIGVFGAGSQFNNAGNLFVGNDGEGILNAMSGSITSNNIYYANGPGSLGFTTITGSTGQITSNGDYAVGGAGTATVDVFTGGSISNTTGYIGQYGGSNGTVNLSGTDIQWNNSGNLFVGNHGTGNLNVNLGAVVTNNIGNIGRYAGSTGIATINGTGTQWNSSGDFFVGDTGNGTLNVQAGAVVSNTGTAYIGNDALGTGQATVNGAGSQWNSGGLLAVGNDGGGAVNITNQGMVTAFDIWLGANTGSQGTATISGTNSEANIVGLIRVGLNGSGTLEVNTGGRVTTGGTGLIGDNSGSVGTATVTGTGSAWSVENYNDLRVGNAGSGILNVLDGGAVNNHQGYIGTGIGSDGTATITGTGSQWNNSANLIVGSYGSGTLNIEDGGVVNNINGAVGFQSNSMGTVNLSGADSQWDNVSLKVGFRGTGIVTQTGGTLSTHNGLLTIGEDATGDGTYNLQGGTLDLNNGDIIAGQGTATFNFTGGTLKDASSINFSIDQLGGTLAPGNSPGTTTIQGNYNQAAAAALEIEIFGTTAGAEFDQLVVTGDADLAGTIEVILDGYNPMASDSFLVLDTTGSVIDNGYTFDFTNADAGPLLAWDTSTFQADGTLRLTPVPEPTSLAILAFGGLVLTRRR